MTSTRYTEPTAASLPIGEAARRVGYSVDTLRRWADEGKIPFFRTPGNQRRFRTEDIDALLAPSTPVPTSAEVAA